MKEISFFALSLGLMVLASEPVLAHRLNVFAYLEGSQICVESSFAGGRAAMNAPVRFLNAEGQEFMSAKTSSEGKVCAKLPEGFAAQDVTVVVNAGEGHQNQWKMSKADFSSLSPAAQKAFPAPLPDFSKAKNENVSTEPKIYSQRELDAAVKAARDEMELKVAAPLRRELAQAREPQTSWRDIVGGIGWLVGFGGLFAWITTRKPKRK